MNKVAPALRPLFVLEWFWCDDSEVIGIYTSKEQAWLALDAYRGNDPGCCFGDENFAIRKFVVDALPKPYSTKL